MQTLIIALVAISQSRGQLQFVNPFIGTGGEGFGVGSTPPGAQVPFGAMRLSPDTASLTFDFTWNHFGGYYYGDTRILCFSHTHLVGAGVEDYGTIGSMPVRTVADDTVQDNGYFSEFDHSNEYASPGYYSVYLSTHHVLAELTVAGGLTGVHKYTFEGSEKKYIVIDALHTIQKGAGINGTVLFNPMSQQVSGYVLLKGSLTGRNGHGVYVYFVSLFDQNVTEHGMWENGSLKPNANNVPPGGTTAAGYFGFSGVNQVTMIFSISFISTEQALLNMQSEWNGRNFKDCQRSAEEKWNTLLGQVNIVSKDQGLLEKFYTALYHVYAGPTDFTEAKGMYIGMKGNVHQLTNEKRRFSDLSLWDVHRSQTPLLALLQPSVLQDVVQSLVDMSREGGALPRWPIANVFGGAMIGNHGYQVILDAYVKGISNFEVHQALEAMYDEATCPTTPHDARPCLKEYVTLGYCPKESHGNSVSLTLAYSFDDWALGTLAQLLGNTSTAEIMLNRSQNYQNVWSNSNQLMCQRDSSGRFDCPLDPNLNTWLYTNDGFTEGNAAQWRWFVPHDVSGLIKLFKSKYVFVEELDAFFDKSQDYTSNVLPNPYYWAGNEPDLLTVYLFCFAGRSDLTQKHVRWLLDNKYTTGSDGLPGNDDYGTMSAWFVWGTFGLYPLTGTTAYFIGSPAMDNALLTLPNGGILNITVYNNSPTNTYVQKVTFNGKLIDLIHSPFIEHKELTLGGTLKFWMTSSTLQFS